MADRPILFSGPMVRALLAGTKTQTRRVFKGIEQTDSGDWHIFGNGGGAWGVKEEFVPRFAPDYAPYAIGDRLWVRETWNVADAYLQPEKRKMALAIMNYAATPWAVPGRWRSPIHMPRWASRLTLTVTDVRVQRLQDISEADAKAEGCSANAPIPGDPYPDWSQVYGAIDAYEHLWNSINAGRAPWDSNPWVCAITFKTALGNIDAIREAA